MQVSSTCMHLVDKMNLHTSTAGSYSMQPTNLEVKVCGTTYWFNKFTEMQGLSNFSEFWVTAHTHPPSPLDETEVSLTILTYWMKQGYPTPCWMKKGLYMYHLCWMKQRYRGKSLPQPEPPQPQPWKYFLNGFGSKHVRFGSKQYRFGSKHCGLFTLLFFHISSFLYTFCDLYIVTFNTYTYPFISWSFLVLIVPKCVPKHSKYWKRKM